MGGGCCMHAAVARCAGAPHASLHDMAPYTPPCRQAGRQEAVHACMPASMHTCTNPGSFRAAHLCLRAQDEVAHAFKLFNSGNPERHRSSSVRRSAAARCNVQLDATCSSMQHAARRLHWCGTALTHLRLS
eukprot:344994-Chlamydomonas_euryale.AAC.1